MLRASSNLFPSYYLTSPPILGNNNNALIRLSLFSSLSLSFSSFKPPSLLPPSASHKFPLHSNKTSLPISPSPTSSWWAPPMDGGNTRPKGRVSFSTGNNGDGGRELLVQHLLVGEDNLKLLTELQQRIAGGVDLSDLAVEYSICPSKEQGGMLGWVRKGQMVPEFEEAAFGAPLNKVVRCKTKFGWHLLQVLAEREESLLQDIEPKELHEKMQDPSFFEEVQLIDVREPDEVAQASLPGFKVLPLRQFGSWGAAITNEFDPQKDTYVLCHHGMRSLQVAKWLQTQGFLRVFNVAGGIHAYAVKVDPSVPTY
ncbi:rhodanese-like/PpiC domain-containing protein 12, chloroplastic [Magnolia sinica]|uniref:rhodanese-like/PpiC domain-containing protein 12, chloroplastic n=1 Tax=Magnolia sinica TaxID=86752 RepID=UPI0026580AF3|nr:rhodanese-like/PpiC domain-containing protein 12, chloroplastic [Magnolia sinica]